MSNNILIRRNYYKEGCTKLKTSYWHEYGRFQFLNITLCDLVDIAADKFGDHVAFVVPYQNISKTYIQFKKDVDQLAIGLIGLELQKNDRIAIWSPNCYEWIITQFATMKAGLILVSLNPALKAAELEYSLNKVQCKTIIAAGTLKNIDLYDILCEVMPEIINSKPGQIYSQKVKSIRSVITLTNKHLPGTYVFNEILKNDGNENTSVMNERMKAVQMDDPAVIMFTSGTTGKSKATTLSHFQLINESFAAGIRLGYDKKPPILCLQVPLFHIFGYGLGPIMISIYGGKCIIPSEYFDSSASLQSIEEERCTIVYGVPTMFFDILKQLSYSNYDYSSIEKILLGASSIPDNLIENLKQMFTAEILNGYGATETSGGICVGDYTTTSGRPVDHIEIKIVDNNGNVVPISTKGEILTRSPYTFLGYWEDKEKTDEVLDSAKWYHTGDIGCMDEDGNVCVAGRIKDCIIRGGENIYPMEIENFLLLHPDISEVYIIGVPDPRLGEQLCCCVRTKQNTNITEKDIKEFCISKLSDFKIPKYVLFCESFPKTESGKIQRFKLQEQCIKLLKL